mmetsp:Transcript_12227/g.27143  ORF Transcript_12227/g.27143 Transcript_12227/m.27143 type:complete len:97 (+) Transcript_12227:674-964(+)
MTRQTWILKQMQLVHTRSRGLSQRAPDPDRDPAVGLRREGKIYQMSSGIHQVSGCIGRTVRVTVESTSMLFWYIPALLLTKILRHQAGQLLSFFLA